MNYNLPNFLCVGAQKTATSSFFETLKMHPDVFAPEDKEINYFNVKMHKENGLEEYCALFQNAGEYKIRTECSPNYLYDEDVPQRIFDLLGKETKILIFIRQPIERAFSHYMMMKNKGYEKISFEEAFQQEAVRIKEGRVNRNVFSYFDRGLYSAQVKRYLDLFPNVKVILFEDFIEKNAESMQEIYAFLGIDDCALSLAKSNIGTNPKNQALEILLEKATLQVRRVPFLRNNRLLKAIKRGVKKLNAKPKKMEISPSFQKVLQDYYYQDICALEVLIGKDLSHWKNKGV